MPLLRFSWVKCVLMGVYRAHEHDDGSRRVENKTWCGRVPEAGEWTFNDASHAALNGHQKGRLVACGGCRVAITEALRQGSEE